MNMIWMDSPWVKALGWTFIHSVWQIALVGLILFIALRIIPGKKANLRYTISTLSLLVIFVSGILTLMLSIPKTAPASENITWVLAGGQVEQMSNLHMFKLWLEARIPYMLIIWFGGIAILLFRLAISMGWVWHVKSNRIEASEIAPILTTLLHRIKVKMNVEVGISGWVPSPVTLGHLKPIILFPVGLVNQLTPAEVEAILAHELAHIVRHDYLTNIAQSCMETLFYYHPVTWWISRTVRAERENRADDLAVSWYGDKIEYAKAILAVQEIESRRQPALAMGFASRKGQMLNRIHRILNLPYKNQIHMEKSVLFSLGSILCLVLTLSNEPALPPFLHAAQPETTADIAVVVADTLPSEGIYQIHKKTMDQDIKVEIENGNVKNLEINGKVIPAEEYDVFENEIQSLFNNSSAGKTSFYSFVMPEIPTIPDFNSIVFADNIQFDSKDIFLWNGDSLRRFSINGDSVFMNLDLIISDSFPFQVRSYGFNMADDLKHIEKTQRLAQSEIEAARREMAKAQKEWMGKQKEWSEKQNQMLREREYSYNYNYDIDKIGKTIPEISIRIPSIQKGYYLERGVNPNPEMSLSQLLVHDELVDPGEEANFLLTQDKLKINGKRMPDSLHKKYLRRYSEMQGFNVPDNFRLEFKTKTSREF